MDPRFVGPLERTANGCGSSSRHLGHDVQLARIFVARAVLIGVGHCRNISRGLMVWLAPRWFRRARFFDSRRKTPALSTTSASRQREQAGASEVDAIINPSGFVG
jgi:hypothetical protein